MEQLEWWKKILNISLLVSTEYTNVTDRRTDRQTDGHRMTARKDGKLSRETCPREYVRGKMSGSRWVTWLLQHLSRTAARTKICSWELWLQCLEYWNAVGKLALALRSLDVILICLYATRSSRVAERPLKKLLKFERRIMASLWNLGWGHSRSLKMAPFDRSHTVSYSCSDIVYYHDCNLHRLRDIGGYWSENANSNNNK